jgi:ribonuclease G
VARIDAYIVSVTGGGRFVGERKLVRIDEVERAAAVASLLGSDAPNGLGSDSQNGSSNGAANGDALESDAPSRKRSRGRRGGRGRSRAKQGSDKDES